MTIFEKLNEARLRFQNAGIQKSGKMLMRVIHIMNFQTFCLQ